MRGLFGAVATAITLTTSACTDTASLQKFSPQENVLIKVDPDNAGPKYLGLTPHKMFKGPNL